jgi:penicillin-binding protein 2
MKVIHRLMRAALILFVLITILISHVNAGATRHPNKTEKRQQAAKQKTTARTGRAERRRIEMRKRAEAARLAALARQRAAEEALRSRVQEMIAKDDVSGEDPEIRRIAVNALGNHAGTVVVMSPKTGRIFSIVNQQWALREGFKPCSTIKLVTGLAGLNEKVIDPADTTAISDSNRVSLTSALAHSKNEYFQTVGGQVGFNKMISYARLLGLGEKTGINVRHESAGRVPKSKLGFAVNHMSSHGDDFKVTAVQLATLVSAMANGGKLLTPFVAHTAQEEKRSTPKVRRLVDINSESFQRMVPGMIGSVSYGSGRRAFDPQATIAGKTGTCIDHGTWVGLFTSYAPLNDPQFAVAVIAQGSDGRNHFPAAVAGRVYRDLNDRLASSGNINVAARQPEIATTSTAADADTDEGESDDSVDEVANETSKQTTEAGRTIWGDQRKPAESKVKPTLMALPNRRAQPTNNASVNQRPRRIAGGQK